MNRIGIVLAFGFLFCGCANRKTDAFVEQYPRIGIQWPESYWLNAENQAALNMRSGYWMSMIEASAYLTVCQILQNLDLRTGEKLIADQNRWLIKTKREAKSDADEYQGGTMSDCAYNASFGGLAQIRLEQLEKRLGQLREKPDRETRDFKSLSRPDWMPVIFIVSSDEETWKWVLDQKDAGQDWHHWAEFQDMKLEVAYAYLHLNLPAKEWPAVEKESESWPEEKSHVLAQPAAIADEKDKLLGRAASKRFAALETRFAILKFSPDPSGN